MTLIIRSEETNDIRQVREIVWTAFPTDAESKLVDALRENGKAVISLVAVEDGDQALGHILFSPVSSTPPGEAKGIGLAPVAVHPDVQSRGIDSGLIQEGLRLGKELMYDYCVVLGDPKYYGRFGFEKASQFGLQNEYGVDDEFMVMRFTQHKILPGLVQYASEFALFLV
jgi:putative acetyltransferase